MTELSDDTFTRQTGGWTARPDDSVWVLASSSDPNATEMCPICVLLLETEEGQALFGKYMYADIQIISDGKGNVASRTGWVCKMCGASGEGRVPEFHDKPKSEL